jgi:hypothetical protein
MGCTAKLATWALRIALEEVGKDYNGTTDDYWAVLDIYEH